MSRTNQGFYTLQFDGACSGNPGPAGAGGVLLDQDGSVLYCFREGLGHQTDNVAEYRALILGLEQAITKRYMNINVQGDSVLVIRQFQGSWGINNPQLRSLCDEALELSDNFHSFSIQHISRDSNSRADAQANRAIHLPVAAKAALKSKSIFEGQFEEDCLC